MIHHVGPLRSIRGVRGSICTNYGTDPAERTRPIRVGHNGTHGQSVFRPSAARQRPSGLVTQF